MEDLDVLVQIQSIEDISESKAMKIMRKFVDTHEVGPGFHASNQIDRTPDEIIEKMKIMINASDDQLTKKKKFVEKKVSGDEKPDETEGLNPKKKKQRKKQL